MIQWLSVFDLYLLTVGYSRKLESLIDFGLCKLFFDFFLEFDKFKFDSLVDVSWSSNYRSTSIGNIVTIGSSSFN